MADFSFRNMAPHIINALSEPSCPWHVLAVIESSSAATIDYLPRFPVTILVMHDIRALVYLRRARVCRNPWKKLLFFEQFRRYKRFERLYCQKYDLIVTVSKTDEQWVKYNYHPKRTTTVPLPLDSNYFSGAKQYSEVKNRIVFTGLMSHPPNADAAIFFAKEIFPIIRASVPESEFLVVGRYPPPEVESLKTISGVTVTGAVEDIRPYLLAAMIVVVPLRFGSGSRQKILEAWALERCVVSTSIGAEGLDYKDGENLLIADSAEEMAKKITHLITTPELRETIRSKGRNIVTTQHQPKIVTKNYVAQIKTILKKRTSSDNIPMKIGLDLRWLVPGLYGGVENLARSFLNELLKIDFFNQYKVLLLGRSYHDFDWRNHQNFQAQNTNKLYVSICHLTRHRCNQLYQLLRINSKNTPQVLELRRSHDFDVDFVYSFPGYIHPDLNSLSNVLVVPDIQHEFMPHFFTLEEIENRRRIYRDSIQRAVHICAISKYTRQTLIEKLNVRPDKITAVQLAADPLFLDTDPTEEETASVLRKYELIAGEYLYFPAHTWPHKNHIGALEALSILKDRYNIVVKLVLTGGARNAHQDIGKRIQDLQLENQVKAIGYVPLHEVPYLYHGASVLVYPSYFEGFGMPVLEAMTCGCPVVCSNTSSLPEIAGNAALLVPPDDPSQIAEKIYLLLTDTSLRKALIAKGKQQAAKFSWKRHTIETLKVFKKIQGIRTNISI